MYIIIIVSIKLQVSIRFKLYVMIKCVHSYKLICSDINIMFYKKNGLPEKAHNLNLLTEACCPLLSRDEQETEDCDLMSTVQQSANVCRKNWLLFPDHLHSEITQSS